MYDESQSLENNSNLALTSLNSMLKKELRFNNFHGFGFASIVRSGLLSSPHVHYHISNEQFVSHVVICTHNFLILYL